MTLFSVLASLVRSDPTVSAMLNLPLKGEVTNVSSVNLIDKARVYLRIAKSGLWSHY